MIYINAYGKKNQRLNCFRDICNDQSWRDEKDLEDEFAEQSDEDEIVPIVSMVPKSVSVMPVFKPSTPIKQKFSGEKTGFESDSTKDSEVSPKQDNNIWAKIRFQKTPSFVKDIKRSTSLLG